MVYCETGSNHLVAFNDPLKDLLASLFIVDERDEDGGWLIPHKRDKILCFTILFLHDPSARKDMKDEIKRIGNVGSNGILYTIVSKGKLDIMLVGVIKMVVDEIERHREYYKNCEIY